MEEVFKFRFLTGFFSDFPAYFGKLLSTKWKSGKTTDNWENLFLKFVASFSKLLKVKK